MVGHCRLQLGREHPVAVAHPRCGDASYVVNTSTGITSGSATIAVTAGTGTIVKGDVFTIAGVFEAHPETKANTGRLQQFVCTADYAGGAGNVTVADPDHLDWPAERGHLGCGCG